MSNLLNKKVFSHLNIENNLTNEINKIYFVKVENVEIIWDFPGISLKKPFLYTLHYKV